MRRQSIHDILTMQDGEFGQVDRCDQRGFGVSAEDSVAVQRSRVTWSHAVTSLLVACFQEGLASRFMFHRFLITTMCGCAIALASALTVQQSLAGDGDKQVQQVPGKLNTQPQASETNKDIGYWVGQLGNSHYLRREAATKHLIQFGPDAIPDLARVIDSGDLEVIERAVGVIAEIAFERPPNEDGGAWDTLQKLADAGVGRQASVAKGALSEIRNHRAKQARQALTAAGVFVGVDELVIRAISRPVTMIQIDDQWDRDPATLQWLRWLDGVENARLKGSAVTAEVVRAITEVPDLRAIAIVDAIVDDETLQALTKIKRLHSLEFRYVPLTDDQGDLIASIPVRVSLSLMGTGISAERVELMRSQLPGLQVEHRQGGFLGVTCMDSLDVCEITGVLPGSAAEKAGIIQGDIILKIDDAKIDIFQDLQNAINQHLPGDEVDVTFRRGEKIEQVKLQLGRLEES